MAILLPQQFYSLAANIGKSYFENLKGGANATITVNNNGPAPIDLVVTRVNAPVITYVIPPTNSLTLEVALLLVAALQTTAAGAATGTIQIATADF
ncbi:hypothetical protein ABEW60_04200 [Paenibacillus jamilae]|uniref:hypothetical protein n=1 Tax=Paenibacillus TaxID=44249 RepID=UPI000472DE24|nr:MULTISPECIES: hypothetical protein [Paenibacillus]MDY8022396.1 hypothetical protein [Paenibacillus polymyxa]QYK69931.1 hypothetical protein KAI36_05139 [Paenibacillus sp. S02]